MRFTRLTLLNNLFTMSAPKTPTHVDLLIVGGGPAGLSAALMFSRLQRPTLVYDSGLYRNSQSPIAHTIFGNEGIDPAAYRQKARSEIQKGYEWTKFVDGKIVKLVKSEGGFEAEDEKGSKVLAKRVILATGVRDILPPISGERHDPSPFYYIADLSGLQEAWGRRAIHCIFCHGTETRGQSFGFLLTRANANFNPMIAAGAFKLWATLAHTKVYFLTQGMDVSLPEDLAASGLEKLMPVIRGNPYVCRDLQLQISDLR